VKRFGDKIVAQINRLGRDQAQNQLPLLLIAPRSVIVAQRRIA
jgi:hypothetical protein